jgi:G3E family GTPase
MKGSENNSLKLQKIGDRPLQVNVVMGELGSGKTTVILSLVKQVAGDDYKVVWLKNEYGDVNVDGALANEQGIKTEEIMNGCLCCTAVGQIEGAIEEVLNFGADRLIIETAGMAHPAPIAMELKRFPNLTIDSFIEVVDAVNFGGYEDRTAIGQSHSQYVDFVVINKIGLIDDRRMDDVLDLIGDNYSDTPQVRTADGSVSASLILGWDGLSAVSRLNNEKIHEDAHSEEAHIKMQAISCLIDGILEPTAVERIMEGLPLSDVYRAKGVILTPDGWQVMNRVANRTTWQPIKGDFKQNELLFVGPYAQDHQASLCEQLESCRP